MNRITFGTIMHMSKGKKPKKEAAEPQSVFLPYVDIQAFEKGKIASYANGENCIPCEEGDILIVCDGSRSGLVGFAIKGYVGSTLAVISAEGMSQKYLFYFLQSLYPLLNTRKKGTGTPHLDQNVLKNAKVCLPPLEEQARIVARIEELFSQLESGVETLKQTKEQLAVYRQAVLSCAFPELTDTNKKLLMEIADITGGITKGRHLEGQDVIELPYLRVANVQDGYLDLSEMKTIQLKRSEREKYLLQYDDVLYTEGGDRDKLGRGTVWRNEISECVHQNHIFKARINQELAIPQYVAYWSLSRDARNYFYTKGKQTVNLASINKTVLSNLPLPIPTLEEQRKTISEIEDRLSVCDQIEQTVDAALQQAEALRQSILKKAFEGGL